MNLPDVLLLGIVGVLGFLCQWLAWRVKLPAILFLLIVGMLLGPTFHLLDPDALFGDLLLPFVSLSVAIILFEGSLTLKLKELREIGPTVRNLVTHGAAINAVITTVATHYFIGLGWELSALFGVIMVVTGPTVIMPMIRTIRPKARIAATLRWEGIVIDPLGALLAVLVYEWILTRQSDALWIDAVAVFTETIFLGLLVGIVCGHLFGLLLRNRLIPEYLQNFAAIALVVGTFAASNTLMHESGLLAVTIMGIWLTNMKNVHTRDILSFKESLTIIFVSALFIILAARIDFSILLGLGWGAVGVLLVMQFIARPVKLFISSIGSDFSLKEKLLLAWVGPRGIVAAAVSAVFALKLEQIGMINAELLVPLAFSIIIGTVVVQSATAKYFARKLGVTEPDTQQLLIVGANPLAIAIATALKESEIQSTLCDTDWNSVSAARMQGLDTYFGNPTSDHADLHLDTSSMGGLLGLSQNQADNSAAAIRFREDFGQRRIFVLATPEDEKLSDKHTASEFYRGRVLFRAPSSFWKLYRLISQGAKIKNTLLSETYSLEDWQRDKANSETIKLFAIDPKNKLFWFTGDDDLPLAAGWRLYTLGPAAAEVTTFQ